MRVIKVTAEKESGTLFLLDVTNTEKAGFKMCFLCSDQKVQERRAVVSAGMAARTLQAGLA